jgi:hypothetical protein
MSTSDRGNPSYREMTVAHIREPKGAPYTEVVFLESARFYRLATENPRYSEILKRLRDSLATGRALKVRCASLESADIEQVESRVSGASEHQR